MTFYDSRSYDPTLEEIVGSPEEIIEMGQQIPGMLPALSTLVGRCEKCWSETVVGTARFKDDLVTLPDGSYSSLAEWPTTRHGDWSRRQRFKAECDDCGLSEHMAWKVR